MGEILKAINFRYAASRLIGRRVEALRPLLVFFGFFAFTVCSVPFIEGERPDHAYDATCDQQDAYAGLLYCGKWRYNAQQYTEYADQIEFKVGN